MSDFGALTSVVTAALPATLTFLYQRLDHLINKRHNSPEDKVETPPELVGDLKLPLQAKDADLEEHRFTLETLHDALDEYYRGNLPINASDERLLRQLGRLRGVLEELYGQNLTFTGEQRPPSGPHVQQKIGTAKGEVLGIDADEVSGEATVIQDIDTAERDSTTVGMRTGRIGHPTHRRS